MVWTEKAQKLGLKNSHIIQKKNCIKRIKEYNKNPKICKLVFCNNKIPYKNKHIQKFCSQKCAGRKKPILCCIFCNKQLEYGKSGVCSKGCKEELWFRNIEQKIINGEISRHKTIKRYLFKKHGNKCCICKRKTWMGQRIPIEMDHIDGNNKNNLLINVRLLCVNCHAQTPTWKFKKGRRKISDTENRTLSLGL